MSLNEEVTMDNLDKVLKLQPLNISDNEKKEQIEAKLKRLHIDGATAMKISDIFLQQLKSGLEGKSSAMLMLNTYISQLPDGTEEGEFLALDLGGTNFRVLLVVLERGCIVKEQSENYFIEDNLRTGCGIKLFDFIAECICSFVKKHNLTDQKLPLGFTFSFPMDQTSLSSAKLLMWTTSFSATRVEGQDVVQLLRKALLRKGLCNVSVVAIINDSTGTLLHGSLIDPNTSLGVILGTGTNGCYLEKAVNVPRWNCEDTGTEEVAINTEWGCIADTGLLDFIKTDSPTARWGLRPQAPLGVDPNKFEKFTGGGFVGELVRYILVALASSNLIFDGTISQKLAEEDSFPSPHITKVEEDTLNHTTTRIEEILKSYDQNYTLDDIAILKYICEMVSRRAAVLISICCAEVLKHMNKPKNTVAVDGSFYKYHPRIKLWISEFVSILAPEHKCHFIEADDGSGKGAAIAAAVAFKLQQQTSTS